MNRRNERNDRKPKAAGFTHGGYRGKNGNYRRQLSGRHRQCGGEFGELRKLVGDDGHFRRRIENFFRRFVGPNGEHGKRRITIQASSPGDVGSVGVHDFAGVQRDFFRGPIDLVAPAIGDISSQVRR